MRSREGYFGVYFPSCEINTKITLEWAHKQFVTRVHTLFYFLHDITNPEMTLKTTIFAQHPRVSLARFTLCWWRHNRLVMTSQWPDNCDANTWQVISNSLDIDFIHGDIHGRSCKKAVYVIHDFIHNSTCKFDGKQLSHYFSCVYNTYSYTFPLFTLQNNFYLH